MVSLNAAEGISSSRSKAKRRGRQKLGRSSMLYGMHVMHASCLVLQSSVLICFLCRRVYHVRVGSDEGHQESLVQEVESVATISSAAPSVARHAEELGVLEDGDCLVEEGVGIS